jgi:hypothetical protein
MSLPPQILRIKRKRAEDPVDALCSCLRPVPMRCIADECQTWSAKDVSRIANSRKNKTSYSGESSQPESPHHIQDLNLSASPIPMIVMVVYLSLSQPNPERRMDSAKDIFDLPRWQLITLKKQHPCHRCLKQSRRLRPFLVHRLPLSQSGSTFPKLLVPP